MRDQKANYFFIKYSVSALFAIVVSLYSSLVLSKTVIIYERDSIIDGKLSTIIRRGVDRSSASTVFSYQKNNLKASLKRLEANDKVISLGGKPDEIYSAFKDSKFSNKIVFGAHALNTNLTSISLLVNSKKLLNTLKKASPKTKHIHTVVTDRYDTTHLQSIQDTAKNLGFVFSFSIQETPTGLAKEWSKTLDSINPNTGIVMIIDPTYMDRIGGLNYILRKTWKSKVLVATTVQKYSKSGVSLGLFQDFESYGHSLYKHLVSNKKNRSLFMSDYNPVINIRSFSHNGLSIRKLDFDRRVVFIK